MDPKQLFKRSLDNVSPTIILCVTADQFSNETPCTDWDLKELLNHLLYELAWVPDVLAGKTIAEVGSAHDGDLVGDNLQASWKELSDKALTAVEAADMQSTVHLSYGDVAAEHYVAEMAADVMIHGWDIGQSVRCTLVMDKDVAGELFRRAEPRKEEFANSGLFAPAIDVPDEADIQTRLLALYGRYEQRVG